jgi:hypothetical protein
MLVGTIAVIVGCALIIFRKPFVRYSVGYQIWAFRMPFGKRVISLGYWLVPIFGLTVVIAGILILLGVFKVKS